MRSFGSNSVVAPQGQVQRKRKAGRILREHLLPRLSLPTILNDPLRDRDNPVTGQTRNYLEIPSELC